MGNKLGRKRQVVDEKHTRPQGLYQHKDVDHKKLRKLILDSKLAPCYPGDDEYTFDLEECPICLLYYPSLNRSRCCTKGICTECFLQMKPPHSTRPTQCPFCKTANYAVEYRGMRSKEEKGMEQIEEQRVIEAKIRMRQQELQDDLGKTQRIQQINSSRRIMIQGEIENIDVSSGSLAVPSFSFPAESDEITSSHGSGAASTTRQPSQFRQNRDNKFDLDLDDIMLMEAIWLSIKDGGSQKAHGDTISESSITEDQHVSPAMVPLTEASSPSGGLACAIAALAERQQINGDSSTSNNGNLSTFNLRQESTRLPNREEQEAEEYHPENWSEVSPDSRIAIQNVERRWGTDPGSEMAEAGTSYAHHDTTRVPGLTALPLPDDIEDEFQPSIQGPILPESFEEQMMLAMAISLAEAQARTNTQEAPWL